MSREHRDTLVEIIHQVDKAIDYHSDLAEGDIGFRTGVTLGSLRAQLVALRDSMLGEDEARPACDCGAGDAARFHAGNCALAADHVADAGKKVDPRCECKTPTTVHTLWCPAHKEGLRYVPEAAAPSEPAGGPVERRDLGHGTTVEMPSDGQFIVRFMHSNVVINREEIEALARFAGLPVVDPARLRPAGSYAKTLEAQRDAAEERAAKAERERDAHKTHATDRLRSMTLWMRANGDLSRRIDALMDALVEIHKEANHGGWIEARAAKAIEAEMAASKAAAQPEAAERGAPVCNCAAGWPEAPHGPGHEAHCPVRALDERHNTPAGAHDTGRSS